MDWSRYVRERLHLSELDPAREASIVAELAQQLEQAARAGRDPEREIPDWPALARKIEREAAPASERWAAASDLVRDLRHAFRTWRAPGFAIIAILTLALGIGANTAMFSWVNAELLAALPYAHSGRLLILNEWADGRKVSVSFPDYVSWRQDNRKGQGSFVQMAWVQWFSTDLSGAGAPEVVASAGVSANYFSTLGILPVLGRSFSPGADSGAAKHEAVITWALAHRQFGTAANAVGKTINLDQKQAYAIVGILPPQYRDPNQTLVFLPDGLQLKNNADRGNRGDSAVIGERKPGVTVATAAAEMRAESARLSAAYPDDNNVGSIVAPLRSAFVGNDAPMLWLLLGAVGLVLLIACANVANLMLTRTAARQQEWSVRSALGAGRARLVRQLLAESLALGLVGTACGLLVAWAGMRGLAALMPIAAKEVVALSLNPTVLAFTVVAALIAIVLFGLGPALTASRPVAAGRGNAGLGWRARREALLVAEVALALMLTAAAGLLLRSFANLVAVNPGFQPSSVLTVSRRLAGPHYTNDPAVLQFEQQALARYAALPGVDATAIGTNLPLTGSHSRTDVSIVGRPLPQRGHYPHPDLHEISPGYLPAMGLPLLSGRNFDATDTTNSPAVVLISEHFARLSWSKPGDALGQQLCCGRKDARLTIIGIVGNTRQYGLNSPANIELYLPFTQYPPQHPTFVLRTSVPPLTLAHEASAIFHRLDPNLPAPEVQTMQQLLAASVGQPRAMLWLLEIFGALALLLAAIGIYGVVSYATERRTAEIGIRMALGANRTAVARMIGGQTLKLVAIGIALGLVGVLTLGHTLKLLLFQVSAADPLVLALAALVLLATGTLACAIPIRRATRVDPITALRQE
ncbi:MAG: ABC transporter permease [Acidobacteria bacterium]|nr:MAG: ABC transporter permease [Acidobacteriota bacterium]